MNTINGKEIALQTTDCDKRQVYWRRDSYNKHCIASPERNIPSSKNQIVDALLHPLNRVFKSKHIEYFYGKAIRYNRRGIPTHWKVIVKYFGLFRQEGLIKTAIPVQSLDA